MSRGKPSVGKAIAFRLPLNEDEIFREKAKAEGLSPGQYARKLNMVRGPEHHRRRD